MAKNGMSLSDMPFFAGDTALEDLK